ncbi:hypothetical protein E2C01_040552 [Portunus trituberculatus]|uniref:Uncharacterized protein n=1 Tax=Portunus trituberculatus TaxID=210409 RepID=A0A5B7FJZ5_PORTR|nr:hypothetical protein [Portunus trituberculatus]
MAKCFKAVGDGIPTQAWTSARSHAHHLIHYAITSRLGTVTQNVSPSYTRTVARTPRHPNCVWFHCTYVAVTNSQTSVQFHEEFVLEK